MSAKRHDESGTSHSSIDNAIVYNLMGEGQLPLLKESQKFDEHLLQYFTNKHGQERSYKMPVYIESLDDMRARIVDHFPIMDMPQIFGLHDTATIKTTTDLAANILHQTYIYQFVVKRPKKIVLN